MANKSSGGKSGGGRSMPWNPAAATLPHKNQGYGISGQFGTQTVTAQPPAGQLPAMGQPDKGNLSSPVMPQLPSAQQQQQAPSMDMQQQFQGLNPFVKWFFAQQAQRRGLGGPAMAYQNFYNRHHP